MAEKFSLKDELFNLDRVTYLAELFHASDSEFDRDGFIAAVMERMLDLELMARIGWIAQCLTRFLPDDFANAVDRIEAALPPELDPSKSDDDFGSFIFAPLSEYVVMHGLNDQHFERSMVLLHAITRRFSVEFAMRHFLIRYPERVLAIFDEWARDDNYHVRRLVSESTRPVLPWGKKVALEQTQTIPLLDQLYADRTRFVTRSVANHLNDISKIDPELVVATLHDWRNRGAQDAKEMAWMCKHALRTLIKQGDMNALSLLGYRENPAVTVGGVTVPKRVKMDDYLEISSTITATQDEPLIVDFIIEFVKANGERKPKVFKLKQFEIKEGQVVELRKRHRLVANATTFKLFTGAHRVHLQVNGRVLASTDFELIA
ncbi:hypothetical protein GCM10008927_19300 [Amylibacter ulvae]|uniref:DNA alkylation repair protein n=1 Tax=Paramylibacter ulvae TaxID=1651968 RepID=A0ABQ3D378_9RHOB|nr:DNA alkylation repair protein [Amylibacter ulvae]GHA53592.1 hypothetical protein GCM10008927_19300 [Amylibacter ulvae]